MPRPEFETLTTKTLEISWQLRYAFWISNLHPRPLMRRARIVAIRSFYGYHVKKLQKKWSLDDGMPSTSSDKFTRVKRFIRLMERRWEPH